MDEKASKKLTKVADKADAKGSGAKPGLLSGGNPQIAKADGDAPVQAYIAAMPGWKSDLGRPPRRAYRARGAQRAQGCAMELALLRH